MRVLVIGATGALGRLVVPRLLTAGHDVTAVGRAAPHLEHLASLGAKAARVDLFDAAAIATAMRGHDAVINVATRVPSPSRMMLPGAWKEMARVRTEGSAIVADAARANGVGRLVQESFAPTYPDRGDRWITEETGITPAAHASSVADAEDSALRFGESGGAAVVLRFGMFYSAGDAFADQVIGTVRKGWAPFLGSPDAYVSLVTHDDAAAAAVAALGMSAGIYNVVDDEPLTRRALADDVARMVGVAAPKFLPRWVASLAGSLGDTMSRSQRVSNAKLKAASAWTPMTPDACTGFRKIIEA